MSDRSYTPPIQNEAGSRDRTSRCPTRDKNVSRRRRSTTKKDNRSKRKRDTWRSRSRRKTFDDINSSSSESKTVNKTTKRRHRSVNRNSQRHNNRDRSLSITSSASSSTSNTSCTTDDDRSSSNTEGRSSRSRERISASKRKRSKRSSKTPAAKKTRTKSPVSTEMDFLTKFAKLIKGRSSSTFDGAHNVIPEFDPDANSQTAADWIRKVKDTATIYKWNEKQVIYHAIPKLTGYAKKWYQGRSSVNLSWKQWQRQILKTFPDDRNYADRLYEMLERKSKRDESLEEYFHDKIRLVRMCGITGRNAVDCVINGIFDNNIRLNAQGSSIKRPSQLLTYLRRISKKTYQVRKPVFQGPRINNDSRENNGNRVNNLPKPNSNTLNNRFKNTRCYNCSEFGHTVQTCPKPILRCDKCSRLGHETQQCRQSNATKPQQKESGGHNTSGDNKTDNKRVLQITKDETQNGKYFKHIQLNGTSRSCYVDFGSQCTLIKSKIAEELNLLLDKVGLPVIKGFGLGSVVPLGRVTVTIEIDAVKADVDAYVVFDDLLNTDVLVGQSLTELPSVTVYKSSTQLTLYCDDTKVDRLEIFNSSDIIVEGLRNVTVHVKDVKYTGFLFIPGYVCLKSNNEHCILQGAYEFTNGKGRIILINFSKKPLKLLGNKILARATTLTNTERLRDKSLEVYVNSVSENESHDQTPKSTSLPIKMDMLNVGPKVSNEQKAKLLVLLNRHRNCFAFNMQELGLTKVAEMTIRLNDDNPVTYKPYRLPFSERAVVREMVGELLANNIIRDSDSAYASPIVLVRKKNNEYRLCIDYRALNKKTIKDSYPMPVIEDQLDRLHGKTLFTSLDLASGYYQIPVEESSRHLTAFITPDGHYEFTRMPFGLVNAPAVFQHMINKALGNRRFDLAIPYLDDLLSTGSTFEESFQKLEEILDLLSNAGLTLNLKKCFFFQSEIDYLGYHISESGLQPGITKTRAVSEFPTPTNVHQVRQFVGLASFFRRFIYNFASLVKPLTKLTKTDVPWQWASEQESAFQDIKTKLISRPILALYNSKHTTEVHCDASKIGVGGVLLQKGENDEKLRPVAYFSRQTTREEAFWHSYELETMAVVLSLKKFRVYLLGLEFKVMTDCVALRTTLTKRDLLPKVARWWLMLQEFNFTIEYRPGHNMQHVDALSRNPMPIEDQEELEILQITTNDWLHTVQMTDPRLKHIKQILNTSEEDLKDFTNNYILRGDKLYRRVGRKFKWVVPHGARWRICQMNHDEAGHFSLDKTLEKISTDYWFPKMKRFVKKYVTSCINCAYNKEMSGKKTGYLHPIPKTASIFHTLHMDHLGPFIKSKRSNTYILGVIDGFSKFIFVKAVRNTKSKTTIKALEDIFSNFGCPKIVISDQGTSFTSNEFKVFLGSLGIKHVLNAVATPRANGQIERYNRTILNSLAAMNHGLDEKDWDLNVQKLQWSLNNTLNKGIGKSPAEVVFGKRTDGQSENILKGALETEIEDNDHEKIRKTVEDKILETQKKMKETFDKTRAPTKFFKEGDLVMIPNHNPEKGKSKKLAAKFRGPFRITSVLDKDRYEVSNIEGHSTKKYKNIYPADHLKSWITCQGSTQASADSSSGNSSDETNVTD